MRRGPYLDTRLYVEQYGREPDPADRGWFYFRLRGCRRAICTITAPYSSSFGDASQRALEAARKARARSVEVLPGPAL
jgi:hypothetical protein